MTTLKNFNGKFFAFLKSAFFSISTALALMLLSAGVFAIFGASDTVLGVCKIVIRIISIAIFCLLFSDGTRGILKGAISGLTVFLLLNLLFLIITGGVSGSNVLYNLIFSVLFGIILGIIFANLKKTVNNG